MKGLDSNIAAQLKEFDKEIEKYLEGPVSFDEKEESTADDDEEERVGELSNPI